MVTWRLCGECRRLPGNEVYLTSDFLSIKMIQYAKGRQPQFGNAIANR